MRSVTSRSLRTPRHQPSAEPNVMTSPGELIGCLSRKDQFFQQLMRMALPRERVARTTQKSIISTARLIQ
jgi:hypothetical protein